MKVLIQAAAVTFLATSTAQAQQAVQWRVSEGGNGHWYQVVIVTSGVSWSSAKVQAEGRSGMLACAESEQEILFLQSQFGPSRVPAAWVPQNPRNEFTFGPWLGAFQEPGAPEPTGGWKWLTGVPYSPSGPYFNDNACGVPEDRLHLYFSSMGKLTVNDMPDDAIPAECGPANPSYLIEWSADCNNDGIVDYGQCRDGSLPDYDGNNIPDCCEAGAPCVVGNYPVQWRVAEGGNGHWYQYRTSGLPWLLADSEASSLGGFLACIASGTENDVVTRLGREIAWLGGYQDLSASDYIEPAGGWRWVSGEPWTYTNWYLLDPAGPEPNNLGPEHVLITWSGGTSWNDMNGAHPNASLIEWSADCNNDGIVDKGQILRGQLPDFNGNGIPDICQGPTCADADIYRDFNVNGADLGILLSQWGPNTPLTESDLNHDGSVDGLDLGLLLSFWGPCP